MVVREIELKQFPTHVQLSKTKLFKISTQGVYNSKLHYHSRSKVIEEMKKYVKSHLSIVLPINNSLFPIKIKLSFFAPINWGNVRMSKGVLKWMPAKEGYHPIHDLDNLAWIWSKVIQDCLVSKGIIPEDTVEFIDNIEYIYIPIKNFDDRVIIIQLEGE